MAEHRLWFAVLIEAIKDKDHFWLVTEGYEGSYEFVCRTLDIDADRMRESIQKAWLTSSIDFSLLSPGKFEDFVTLTPERRARILEEKKRRKGMKKNSSFVRKVEKASIYYQVELGL